QSVCAEPGCSNSLPEPAWNRWTSVPTESSNTGSTPRSVATLWLPSSPEPSTLVSAAPQEHGVRGDPAECQRYRNKEAEGGAVGDRHGEHETGHCPDSSKHCRPPHSLSGEPASDHEAGRNE